MCNGHDYISEVMVMVMINFKKVCNGSGKVIPYIIREYHTL